MMAQVSGTLGTHEHAMETRVPRCKARPAKPFFIFVAHDPQTAMGHVVASEPTLAGKCGSKLQDMWQHWSPPRQGGEVRCHGDMWQRQSLPQQEGNVRCCRAPGSVRAHFGREAGSGAAWHVAVPKPTSVGRQGLEWWGAWQC
jgi:hypothetical protein